MDLLKTKKNPKEGSSRFNELSRLIWEKMIMVTNLYHGENSEKVLDLLVG